MLIKKKGAWTVEEFGKIVIAIIGILLMIPLIILLVNIFSDDEEANAQNFIKSLDGKIENLKVGETGKFPMQGLDDWVLTGWSDKDEGKPDKCFFNSCICVCPVEGDGEGLSGKCQEGGFCRGVEEEKVLISFRKEAINIVLAKKLLEIVVSKEEDSINFYSQNVLARDWRRWYKEMAESISPWEKSYPDVAFNWGGWTYFFASKEGSNIDNEHLYFKYDIYREEQKIQQAAKVISAWGIPNDVQAAFTWHDGKTYFLKGDKYYKYGSNLEGDGQLTSVWSELPSDIDAAVRSEVSKKTYFFKGTDYYQYNDEGEQEKTGKISEDWGGYPKNAGVAAALEVGQFTFLLFPKTAPGEYRHYEFFIGSDNSIIGL